MIRTLLILFVLSLLTPAGFCAEQSFDLAVYPTVAWQGKVVAVRLISAESVSEVSGSFLGNKFNCYRSGDDYQGVVGVPIDQKVGHYDLKLFITKNDGTKTEISKKMKVWETRFPFSRFWLKPARNKLRARNIINNEWAEIEQVLQVEGQEKLWQGKFSWPVKARVSQGFGHREIINGKRAGNHRGLDIAVISGTKIIAPNSAKVVFAKRLKAFGGTLVLDHGQGIHTLYFHLSKLIAKVGDEVGKGELIALSGNSGISSGAHLHWGMSAHNLRVDPLQWTKYEI